MTEQIDSTIHNPISVPFLHSNLIKDKNILQEQKERSEEIVDSNENGWAAAWGTECGSWNSTDIYRNILEEEKVYSPIVDDLSSLLQSFTNSMGMDWSNMTQIITESWLNANPQGNVQECHIHSHCYISAVYYIHVPDKGGEFVLDNPLSYEHNVGCSRNSPYTDATFNVQSGDLIMFPSNVEHHTKVNMSNEYRYSLAFNITTEELLPKYISEELSK